MSIGKIIKELRHEHDMTQEQLAELLNLTPAAISGWECGRNSPDISQIPLLSRIFGVSADILLGIDLSVQEDKIDQIIFEANKLGDKEAVEILRLGLEQFPASYDLMDHLALALDYEGESETYNSRLKEIIALYEKIREGTKDPGLKNSAEWHLCGIYLNQGKRDEALKIAEGVTHLPFSRDDFEHMLAQGKERVYHMHFDIKKSFDKLCDDIYFFTMINMDEKPFFTHEQAITMLEKIPKFHDVFYENRDFFDAAIMVYLSYTRMAEHYAELNDGQSALRCVQLALENARKVDDYLKGMDCNSFGVTDVWDQPTLPKEKRHTSILANPDYDYPTTTIWRGRNRDSQVQCCIQDFSHERFDFIRDEIQEIITQII